MKYLFIAAAVWLAYPLIAQSPFNQQLTVPIYFMEDYKPGSSLEEVEPNAHMSGIALLFVDTADMKDELYVTDNSDFVVWHEYIGTSTNATFIIPDSQFVGRLEMMYIGPKCKVELWRQDRSSTNRTYAKGELVTNAKGKQELLFFADGRKAEYLTAVFHSLNNHLMQLHTRSQHKIPMKAWFNRDSINVIVGADSQFDSDFDLFWLDKSLHKHLQKMATSAYSKLFLYDKQREQQQDSIVNGNRRIFHHAVRQGDSGMQGFVNISTKADKRSKYIFYKPQHKYDLWVEYEYEHIKQMTGKLTIRKLGLRNLDNGDFVEMDLFDFTDKSLPLVYVDLIRGVVTSSDGWEINNVVHVIEDTFRATKLPFD
jgi:hypothetical protein